MLESVQPLHILHLEDSPRDALLIQDCLEQAGVVADIELVNDRARFENALAEKEWHLILCDYNLPDYDGLAALQRVREKRPLTPVIMLSGSISPEEAVTCMRAGATDYLMKQERAERLAAAVQRAVGEAAERRLRLAADISLREKEERLRLAFMAAGMEAWDVDLSPPRKVRLSPTAPRRLAQDGEWAKDDFEAWLEQIHPEDREGWRGAFEAMILDGSPYHLEYRTRLPAGEVGWAAVWGTLLRDETGTPTRVIGVSQEITGRKKAEAATLASLREKEILLKEIHHRVKNNLQVIASLLRLEGRRIKEPAATRALDGMTGRIHSMALLHEMLYRSDTFDDVRLDLYLNGIVNSLLRMGSAPSRGATLAFVGEPVTVSIEQATPCGLIVQELASNCLRHARSKGPAVTLTLEVAQAQGDGAIHVGVKDNGVGLPADFDEKRKKSLGLQLVTDLARQLGGQLEIASGTEGASFSVNFPKTPARAWRETVKTSSVADGALQNAAQRPTLVPNNVEAAQQIAAS